jgi:glycosyltransferase involved in cell wall biosynthesis
MRAASIAYLIGSMDTGGAEGQVLELLRRLDRTRFEPRLILFESSTSARVAGLVEDLFSLEIPKEAIRSNSRRFSIALGAFLRLCRYLAHTRPDILHAHLPASCIFGLMAGRLCRIPVVMGSRRSLIGAYRGSDWTFSTADRMISRLGHFMVGNAHAVTRELVEIDGLAPDRTGTIYNGVDTERFHTQGSDFWRARHGWENGEVVFGMVANFFGYKRHLDFVSAAAILHRQYPQARFFMAGEDRGELSTVQTAIASNGLGTVVRAMPGTAHPEDLYASMDVLVSCSDSEGFSNVILEAMASGKPVIATAAGGNTEAVVDGSTGFLVPCRSPADLARAAECLLQDQPLRRRIGLSARQRAEDHFSVLTMVRSHEQLYTRLLQRSRQQTPRPESRPRYGLVEQKNETNAMKQ